MDNQHYEAVDRRYGISARENTARATEQRLRTALKQCVEALRNTQPLLTDEAQRAINAALIENWGALK